MEKYRLSDLVKIKNGKDYKALNEGEYPVYGSGGLMLYVDDFLYDKPSVLLPRKGTLSNIQYYEEPFWTVDTIYYTEVNEDKVNPYYLYRYLRSLDLSGFDSGASIPSMTSKTYYSIKLDLPTKTIQDKVAKILKEYDCLIENNTKRINLLEQMAENLYKEWFVRFRFPGHETAEFENGLPKGWESKKLSEVFEVKYGKDHKNIEDGDVPILGSGGVMRYGNKALHSGESVLIPRKGSLNNVMYMNEAFWTVDTMFYTKLIIENIGKYTFYTLNSMDLASYNSGAALPSMTTDILYHLKIVVPTQKVLIKFNEIVESLYKKKEQLSDINENLIKQRDLLLPRLMSGKLEIK